MLLSKGEHKDCDGRPICSFCRRYPDKLKRTNDCPFCNRIRKTINKYKMEKKNDWP